MLLSFCTAVIFFSPLLVAMEPIMSNMESSVRLFLPKDNILFQQIFPSFLFYALSNLPKKKLSQTLLYHKS